MVRESGTKRTYSVYDENHVLYLYFSGWRLYSWKTINFHQNYWLSRNHVFYWWFIGVRFYPWKTTKFHHYFWSRRNHTWHAAIRD
jgi:hypothetical protein